MKWLQRISYAFNIFILSVVSLYWINPAMLFGGYLAEVREVRSGHFEAFPLDESNIVFLGDSITHSGLWEEMFPALPVRNRGIRSETTTNILERLHQVTAGKPRAVFLKIGTNDLTHGPDDREVSYQQYRKIISRIQETSPNTKIFLQSILPRGEEYQQEVEAFNQNIQKIAADLRLPYVDLYSIFLAADGSIADEYTFDEIHLNGLGYQTWRSALLPYLEEFRGELKPLNKAAESFL